MDVTTRLDVHDQLKFAQQITNNLMSMQIKGVNLASFQINAPLYIWLNMQGIGIMFNILNVSFTNSNDIYYDYKEVISWGRTELC